MKKIILSCALFCLSIPAFAQAASRPVNVTWTVSTSPGVVNYTVFTCVVPSAGTSCTPPITGTPVATVTTGSVVLTETTGQAYGISVVTNAAPCTLSTPLTTACGSSAPATLAYVPVPLVVSGSSNIVVVVP